MNPEMAHVPKFETCAVEVTIMSLYSVFVMQTKVTYV